MEIREDAWLAEALGKPVFRIERPEASAACGAALREHAARCDKGLDYAKVPADQVALAGWLGDAGFRTVDMSLLLRRQRGCPDPPSPPKVEVGPHRAQDAAALLRIAGSSFRFSRFHLDPAIHATAADAVKRAWLRSYLEGRRGVALDVARFDGQAVGFNAILEAESEAGRARVIDLIAVGAEWQGMGVGKALVASFIRGHGPLSDVLEVGTQAANVPSVRLYESMGFRLARAQVVLHRHLGGDP